MSSLDRMLTILDLFDENLMSIQLDHAVQATGASKATAYRYIQSLCHRGLLAPAAGGSYVLGPRIIELDRLVRKMDPLLSSASPLIRAASVRLNINQLRSMMLWHSERIREAGLGEDWEDFRSRMTRLRRAGFCVSRAEVFEGLIGISAPIFDAEQRVLGSAVLIIPEQRYDANPDAPYTAEIVALAAAITDDIAKRSEAGSAGAGRAARPRKARALKEPKEKAIA
jgi:DNA-binding IclR family transcriptional regulator